MNGSCATYGLFIVDGRWHGEYVLNYSLFINKSSITMKKISTFAVALLAMSGATSVQAQSTGTGLPTGYYKMKNTSTDRNRVYVLNDEFNSTNTKQRTLLSATDGETNNYIWHITNTGNGKITIVNGQGTPVKAEDGASSKTYNSHSELTLDDSHSTYPTSVYFTEALHAPGNSDPNHIYGDNFAIAYYVGTQGLNSKTVFWNFTAYAPEGKEAYKVVVTGAEGAYVTRTSTTESAYNGGFFFSSDAINQTDFTASSVKGCDAAITVDATAKTINVAYTVNVEGYQALINEAKAVLASKRIGYPKESSTAYTTFNEAITKAEGLASSPTSSAYSELQQAISTFKLSSDNVRMPEDGKAYTLTLVTKAGEKAYMNYAASGYSMVKTSEANNTNYPMTAKFVCHKMSDGRYVFVNNEGKYLVYKGYQNNAINGNKGYVNSYAPVTYTNTSTKEEVSIYPQYLTLAKITNDGNNVIGIEDAYMSIKGLRANTDNTGNEVFYLINSDCSTYNANNVPLYKDAYSSAFLIEETTYPNTVSFNAANGIDDVNYIATFSAKFATVKPDGVKAYIVKTNDGTNATLEEVAGNIPAGEGVILTSESDQSVTMVPVATEEVATVSGNRLGNTAGEDKTIAAGEGVCILSSSANVVAFYKAKANTTLKMNKAYLITSAGSAIALNFGQNVTAINQATTTDNVKALPVYDLTGRRVAKAVKGSLYIQGGKKFIAE